MEKRIHNAKIRRCMALLCIVCGLSALFFFGNTRIFAAQTEAAAELQSRYSTLEKLNQLRENLGLKTLSESHALSEAAQAHCLYMTHSLSDSVLEKPGRDYFTGVSPVDRAQYAGFTGKVSEMSARLRDGYEALLQSMLHDPLRRVQLIGPQTDRIGFGIEGYYVDFLLGSSTAAAVPVTVTYPYAGQQSVGNITIKASELIPEELREKASRGMIGEILTVTFYGKKQEAPQVSDISITLTDTKLGRPVNCELAVRTVGEALIVAAIPTEMYSADTLYEASFSCRVRQTDKTELFEQTWSFTSAAPDAIGEVTRLDLLLDLCRIFGIEGLEEDPSDIQMFRDYPGERSSVSEGEPEEGSDGEGPDEDQRLIGRLIADRFFISTERREILEPEETVTREEAAYWLAQFIRRYGKALDAEVRFTYRTSYSDINKCSPNRKYWVQRAYLLDVIEGQGAEIFSPQVKLTRYELARWLEKLSDRLEEIQEKRK